MLLETRSPNSRNHLHGPPSSAGSTTSRRPSTVSVTNRSVANRSLIAGPTPPSRSAAPSSPPSISSRSSTIVPPSTTTVRSSAPVQGPSGGGGPGTVQGPSGGGGPGTVLGSVVGASEDAVSPLVRATLPANYHRPPTALGYSSASSPLVPKPKDFNKLFSCLRQCAGEYYTPIKTTVKESEGKKEKVILPPPPKAQVVGFVKLLTSVGAPTNWFRDGEVPMWLPKEQQDFLRVIRQNLHLEAYRFLTRKEDDIAATENKLKCAFEQDQAVLILQSLQRQRFAEQAVKKKAEQRDAAPQSPPAATAVTSPLVGSTQPRSQFTEGMGRAPTSLMSAASNPSSVGTGGGLLPSSSNRTGPLNVIPRSNPSQVSNGSGGNSAIVRPLGGSSVGRGAPPPIRGVLTFNNGKTSYLGHILDGKRHGWGLCSYEGHETWSWFVGQWINDSPGIGMLRLRNGIIYFGSVDLYGKRHGLGTCSYSDHQDKEQDRSFISGFWESDSPTWGILTYKDSRHFTGTFNGKLRHGAGCCFFPPGNKHLAFCGHYEDDLYSSTPGMMRYADGTVFHGDVQNKLGSKTKGEKDPMREPEPAELPQFERLVQTAIQHIEQSWPSDQGRILIDPVVNWRKSRGPPCRAVSRFLRGVDHLTLNQDFVMNCTFGWHGTSQITHLWEICREGFDTTKRRRQNQGPGEYFAVHHEDAVMYCQGKDMLILTAILPGFHTSTTPDYAYIVNNPPIHSGVSFCLPIAVVQFDPNREFISPSINTVYRWQFLWQANTDQWIPHEFSSNRVLADGWQDYLLGKGPEKVRFTTPALDVTELDQEYEVDFKLMTQINVRTNYKRKVSYVHVPSVPLPLADPILHVLRTIR